MFKKSLLSVSLAALMLCFGLVGCTSSDAPSASSSSASVASSASASSSAAEQSDEGSVKASVQFDLSKVEGVAAAEGVAPYSGDKEFELEDGATAYDALVATGVQTEGTPSYVTAINGLGEGAAGDASGWMYMVNDEVPSVAANEYVLKDGDKVVWYYGSWS